MPGANFELFISEEALKQLRALPKDLRKRIGERLLTLETSFAGDIKKLTGTENKYRLRVGNQRILFRLARFGCMQ
jgi:mRNA-degrading endonuclease RelE of RelBE toxin-antitoxin system